MQKLQTVLYTDDIRTGVEIIVRLADARADTEPDPAVKHQLKEANRWIRHQTDRIRVERKRKAAQRARVEALRNPPPPPPAPEEIMPPPQAALSTPLPPNTPPVKWPKYRLDQAA